MISVRHRLRRLRGLASSGGNIDNISIPQAITQRIAHQVDCGPRRAAAGVAAVAGVTTAVAVGPVAGILAAGYSAAAILLWHRRRGQRAITTARAAATQQVYLLGADMRAGAATGLDIGAVAAKLPDGNDASCQLLRRRLAAVAALSERLGMPAATLLDRFVRDINTRDRVAGLLAGQTAGTMASAHLLAGLPIVGLLLGEAMGAAPIAFLLHTPVGAGCALAAAGLQALGTRWARQLATVETEAA